MYVRRRWTMSSENVRAFAMVFGPLFLFGAFLLLIINEASGIDMRRALASAKQQVVEVASDRVDPAADGKLVHITGILTAAGPARDSVFGVVGASTIRLHRVVQMYAWEEWHRRIHNTVRMEWQSNPDDSSKFQNPEGHTNPPMALRSASFDAGVATIGAYRVTGAVLDLIAEAPVGVEPGGGRSRRAIGARPTAFTGAPEARKRAGSATCGSRSARSNRNRSR